MDINGKYRRVLTDLYSSDRGLLAYTLYSRYKLEPSEALEFINQYEQDEYITVDDNQRIVMTAKGRSRVHSLLKDIVPGPKEDTPYVKSIMSAEKIDAFVPYLPNKKFYVNYIKEGDEKETSKQE